MAGLCLGSGYCSLSSDAISSLNPAGDAWPLDGDSFEVRRAEQYEAAYRRFRLLYPHLSEYAREANNIKGGLA